MTDKYIEVRKSFFRRRIYCLVEGKNTLLKNNTIEALVYNIFEKDLKAGIRTDLPSEDDSGKLNSKEYKEFWERYYDYTND